MVTELKPHYAQLRAAVDTILDNAVASSTFLGLSFAVINSNGEFMYAGARGNRDFGKTTQMRFDTPAFMASMTKLMTSIAAMQIVDRGLVGLDDDLGMLLPELGDREILVSFDEHTNEGKYEEPSERITLRRLLSHSSGFTYDFSPGTTINKWAVANGKEQELWTTEWTAFDRPLLFNPGTSWSYGMGIDWAGKVVEKVTGLSLEQYMEANIWSVVGMKNTTFHPENRESYEILETGIRANGPYDELSPGQSPWPIPAKTDLGGAGIYSTAEDYAKMLSALIADNGTLLSQRSIEEFFKAQLEKSSRMELQKLKRQDFIQIDIPQGVSLDHALGGLLVEDDIPTRRKKGSMCWDGAANPNWMIDRKSGIACTLVTQILPAQDRATKDLWSALEVAIYKHAGSD